MFLKVNEAGFKDGLDEIGLGKVLKENGASLIKINLARPPEVGHPRTDPGVLTKVVQYVLDHQCQCGIAEGADGYLRENLVQIGLGKLLTEPRVKVIDLDFEDWDLVHLADEEHYIPKCLRDYGARVAIPVTSKRVNMTFSNNVKLFVGAVPRKLYQVGEPVNWRPKIHIDLHKSVANLFRAMMDYAPFGFYINGGTAFQEKVGEFRLTEYLVGDDGVELDSYVVEKVFKIEKPDYLKRLETIG